MGQPNTTPQFIPGDEVALLPIYQKKFKNYHDYRVFKIRPSPPNVPNTPSQQEVLLVNMSRKTPEKSSKNVKREEPLEVFPINHLNLKKTAYNIQRRTDLDTLRKYLEICEKRNVPPLEIIIELYNKHIFEGKPVKEIIIPDLKLLDTHLESFHHFLLDRSNAVYTLRIPGNQLTAKSCIFLNRVITSNFTQLRVLDLSYNHIGDHGVINIIRGLENNKTLVDLNFENCGISSTGCSQLLRALIKNEIMPMQKINLKFNECKDAEVELSLTLVERHISLVLIELYPNYNTGGRNSTDGWLTYDGWNMFMKLKEKLKQNDIRRKSLDSRNKISCHICLDDKNVEEIYILDECYHKFCFDCLREYVITKIKSFETDSIKCPSCQRVLKVSEIRQILQGDAQTTEKFDEFMEKFHKLSLKKALGSIGNQNEKLLYCPNRECENAFLVSLEDFKVRKKPLPAPPPPPPQIPQNLKDEEEMKRRAKELPPVPPKKMEKRTSTELTYEQKRLQNELLKMQLRNQENDLVLAKALSAYRSRNFMRKSVGSSNDNQQNSNNMTVNTAFSSSFPSYTVPKSPTMKDFQNKYYVPAFVVDQEKQKQKLQSTSTNQNEKEVDEEAPPKPRPIPDTVLSPVTPIMTDGFVFVTQKKLSGSNVTCPSCETKICVLCEGFSHPAQTCEQAKSVQVSENDRLFQQWAKENGKIKPCPKCKAPIEKIQGCNHMQCGSCGTEFCWLCLALTDTKDGHFKVGGKCPQWSLNVLGMDIGVPHL